MRQLSRRAKLVVHMMIIGVIAWDLIIVSHSSAADYGFLLLSVMIELDV